MIPMTFGLVKHAVLAPGVVSDEERRQWAAGALPALPDQLPDRPLVYDKRLPMMKARRMSPGARLACEAAMSVAEAGAIDAWIFASRHGETARGVKILTSLAADAPVSPTDFMMSVHNAAAGMFTIESACHAPATSLAAGADSFHMALVEAAGMLCTDMHRVAVVDFDGALPESVLETFESMPANMTYATAWVLERGETLRMTLDSLDADGEPRLASSLQLAAGLAAQRPSFTTVGGRTLARWEVCA